MLGGAHFEVMGIAVKAKKPRRSDGRDDGEAAPRRYAKHTTRGIGRDDRESYAAVWADGNRLWSGIGGRGNDNADRSRATIPEC